MPVFHPRKVIFKTFGNDFAFNGGIFCFCHGDFPWIHGKPVFPACAAMQRQKIRFISGEMGNGATPVGYVIVFSPVEMHLSERLLQVREQEWVKIIIQHVAKTDCGLLEHDDKQRHMIINRDTL